MLAVKHLWNRMSGLDAWLSQSSFLLVKCFLNPRGPVEPVPLGLPDPSLTSLPENPESPDSEHKIKGGGVRE